jgi:AcrR family transcriptional regulator
MVKPYDSASKRRELLRAAADLFYRRSYRGTSLADIATEAGIPLGNIHYYFPSKRALAEAVVSAYRDGMAEAFQEWEAAFPDPVRRLCALVRSPNHAVDQVIRWGCPQGSLCQELEKREPVAQPMTFGSSMLEAWVDWAEQQFRLLVKEDARSRATQLVAGIQGTMLLAHALHSAEVLSDGLARIQSSLVSEFDVSTPRS